MRLAKLISWMGPERREKRYELLPFPDRRGLTEPNGGHPVPEPADEAEGAIIEQSSRAFRLPRFMRPRKAR